MSSHGRLVDADKLLEDILCLWTEYSSNGWEYVGLKDVIEAIQDADEVEV